MATKVIYVEICGGVLQGIYGNSIDTKDEIQFVLRDFDNIRGGDPDPVKEDESPDWEPETYYW